MKIYYKIWVDCLLRMKSQEKNKHNWHVKSMIAMSLAMSLNFLLFLTILERDILGCFIYQLYISSLPEEYSNALEILLLFVLPVVVVNYFLIFRNKRYEKLIEKYPYRNGKLAIPYIMISVFLPVFLVFILVVFIQ